MAATVRSMARAIDDPANSATSKSMCAKTLMDALTTLQAMAPPEQENDKLDDLVARRTARLARVANA